MQRFGTPRSRLCTRSINGEEWSLRIVSMSVLSKAANRNIGQAMHNYTMLADSDRVLIAVSGGVDSLVLTWILKHWQHKAPIRYEILAVYIDNGFDALNK